MKVDSSTVSLAASHASSRRLESQSAQRAWVGNLRPDAPGLPDPAPASFVVSLSNAVISATQADPVATSPTTLQTISDASAAAQNDPNLMLLIVVIEKLTGKSVRLASLDMDVIDGRPCLPDPSECRISTVDNVPTPPRVGFGVGHESDQVMETHERMELSAQGIVRTSDGSEIRFDLSLAMERSYREESSGLSWESDAVPAGPLVIDFDGTAAQLQNGRFRFALEGSSGQEHLPFPADGNGYVLFDMDGRQNLDTLKRYDIGAGNLQQIDVTV